MPDQVLRMEDGQIIEVWPTAGWSGRTPLLGIHDRAGVLLWQAETGSPGRRFFRYRQTGDGEVVLSWSASQAIALAYLYAPDLVAAEGIALLDFGGGGLAMRQGPDLTRWIAGDPDRPKLHFSPPLSWMNDPNGFCRIDGRWHLFYQLHPAGTDWGPMHWGHAASADLFDWTHLPVFLHPETATDDPAAEGGAFSGSALRLQDGDTRFFYTEHRPAQKPGGEPRQVQKCAIPDPDVIRAEAIRTVLDARPEGVGLDFRDPKVWWHAPSEAWRMVLGSAIDGDPAVLLYGSDDLSDWHYLGPLYRAPPAFREQGARAAECPDFFELDGRWVLVTSFVGQIEPESGRHNLLYALVGGFDGRRFDPGPAGLQMLDFGTDFYAMQSTQAGGRRLAFAWVFNWRTRKPSGSVYSGEMSLPRALHLDDAGRLCLPVAAELEAAAPGRPIAAVAPGRYALPDDPVQVRLSGPLAPTSVEARQAGRLAFHLAIDAGGHVTLTLPGDDGNIGYTADLGTARDLSIHHDRGIVEMIAAGGAICGTRRGYGDVHPDMLVVESGAAVEVLRRAPRRGHGRTPVAGIRQATGGTEGLRSRGDPG